MSKRKQPDSAVPTGADDVEINEALLGFDDDAADELGGEDGQLAGEDGFNEDELGDLEDALGDGGEDEYGEDDGDEDDEDGGGAELPPETEDDATLPVDASELESQEEVDLSAHSISTAQARLIAPILVRNGELTKVTLPGDRSLSISDMKEDDELEWDSEEYTDVEAIIIAEYLKASLPKLERLDLARNQISDAGARALSAALAENTTLEYLNLESNHVAERGGRSFVDCVRQNTTLTYLNLNYNSIPSALQQEIREGWAEGRSSSLGLHL